MSDDTPFVTPMPPQPERIEALGDHLIEIHGWLRAELAAVRSRVDELIVDGDGPRSVERTPPPLNVQLQQHCLAFCQGLHGHHGGEDALLFPALEQDHPELAPALSRIREQHDVVAKILRELETLLADVATADPRVLKRELTRLSDELEAHLDFEERELVGAMNALPQARVDEIMRAANAAYEEA